MGAAILESLIAENTALKFDNTRLSNLLEDVTYQIEWLKRQLFGQKSERMVPAHDGQCSLDIEGLTTITPSATTTQTIIYSRKTGCEQDPAWQG